MLGRVLFEEIWMVHAFGITFHRERPSREMRLKHRRDVNDVIDDLSLGKTSGWIKNLIEIRKLELAAFNFDDGWSGHRK